MDPEAGSEAGPRFPEASRRTYFAEERTLLAWWRTGVGVAAVSLAVGGLLPRVDHRERARFVALGVAYGVLALVFIIGGAWRDRAARRAIERRSFSEPPSWVMVAITAYLSVLVACTVASFV
jgi:uncharacterized membrane protein YidH (DUF202 family)